eukprot:11225772-Lingulodinium_polyedra.AAC.1
MGWPLDSPATIALGWHCRGCNNSTTLPTAESALPRQMKGILPRNDYVHNGLEWPHDGLG